MKLLVKRVSIVFIALITMNVTAMAQTKGDMAVGGNLLFGTGSNFTNIGIGGKFFYNITNPIRLAGELVFFTRKDYISMWDLSVYGHYLFPVADKITLYPSVGLGFNGTSYSSPDRYHNGVLILPATSNSSSDLALSLGGGIDYELSEKLILSGELRFKMRDGSRTNFVVGIAYKL